MKNDTKKAKKSRAQKRAKRTRNKLKEAALDAFSEKSIDAVTVEEITEKADVGKGKALSFRVLPLPLDAARLSTICLRINHWRLGVLFMARFVLLANTPHWKTPCAGYT